MLEKDKDYVEFILRCTSVEMGEDKCHCEVGFNGYSNDDFPCMPMDVVCKEFDHKVVLVSKRDFDRLQADNEHYRELAKQREENYNLLLKKIGFDSVIEFENFLVRMGKKEDGSHKTVKEILQEIDPISFEVLLQQEHTIYEWKELTGCSTPEEAKSVIEFGESRYHAYNKINEKFEQLQTENEQLKKKLQVPDPIPEYKELLEKLYSKDDAENLEWTLNHICGGQASVNGWMVTAKLWRRNYETLSKLVGFSSVEEIQDYLTNEAECDTLQEALAKLKDQVKYTCDEWKDMDKKLKECEKEVKALRAEVNEFYETFDGCEPAYVKQRIDEMKDEIENLNEKLSERERTHIVYLNDPLGVIAKWEKVTGYDRPEDFLKWKANIEGIMEAWKDVTGCKYPGDARRLLEKWKTLTKCEKPEAAATWITSYKSACERGNRLAEMVEKLKEEVYSWKNVTGYSTPEDYMHARINCATPFDYTAAWQDATGCVTPDQVKSRIEGLENAVRLTNRNMIKEIESNINEWQKFTGCDSPQKAGCKINNLCDEICKLKGDYDHLLKLTGYKSEHDIRVLLNNSEQFVYESVRELINSLKRKAKFTDSNWQKATDCNTPEAAKCRINNLIGEAEAWESDYNHLLALTGFDNEGDLEDFLDTHRDRNKLTTVLEDYETEIKEWQKATGRIDPEAAKQYIDRLKGRLNKIHGYSVDW